MSSFEDQKNMGTALERFLRNKHIDLILLCAVLLGFMAMLIISAIPA